IEERGYYYKKIFSNVIGDIQKNDSSKRSTGERRKKVIRHQQSNTRKKKHDYSQCFKTFPAPFCSCNSSTNLNRRKHPSLFTVWKSLSSNVFSQDTPEDPYWGKALSVYYMWDEFLGVAQISTPIRSHIQ